jgi:hypothetical protein
MPHQIAMPKNILEVVDGVGESKSSSDIEVSCHFILSHEMMSEDAETISNTPEEQPENEEAWQELMGPDLVMKVRLDLASSSS